MASPSKKSRISATRPSGSLPLTLVVSTPQNSISPVISSPQVSCIRASSSERFTASSSSSIKSSSSRRLFREESESDSSIGPDHGFEEDYETYFQQIRRIKYGGRIWNLYRPLVEDTLYEEILTRPQSAKEHAKMLYHLYQRNQKKAIHRLFQFAVDVSGFQKLDISNIEGLGDGKGIIDRIESLEVLREHETLKKTGKCLLQERGLAAKPFQMGIYHFIDTLVMVGYENNVLFDQVLLRKFIKLMKFMSESKLSPVKYTGTVFVLKIITTAVKLCVRVHEEMNNITDAEYDTHDQLVQGRQNLNDLIDLLYLYFSNKCGIADNKLMILAIECAHEIKTWVKYFPKKFISDYEITKHLKTLSINPSKAVRYEALVVCEYFVSTPHIWRHLQSVKDVFLGLVGERLYDVDIKVTTKAIDVFIALIQHTNTESTVPWMKDMLRLVFDKYYPIASAACKFFSIFFNKESSSSEQIILDITKLVTMPDEYAKELVVEGFLPHCSVLRSWKLYVNFLMEDQPEVNKNAVAALFSEVLCQILTGKPTVPREKSITEPADITIAEHSRIFELLPNFNEILKEHTDNPTILKDILKIIPALNPVQLPSNYAKDCMTMWKIIQKLYDYHTDEALLEALAEALFFFHTTVEFADRAARFTADFIHLYKDIFQEYLENSDSGDEELNDVPLKVAVLYSHANLNFDWQKIFLQLQKCTSETLVHMIRCCTWHSLWDLRTMSKEHSSNLEQPISSHKKRLDSLLREIFSKIRDLKGSRQHYEVYSQLCDFLLKYQEELKPARKSAKIFDKLKLDLESEYVRIINNFLDKYVIYRRGLTVGNKQKYFADYIALTNVGVISLEHSAFAYKYYLEFNDEFGDIIEKSMEYHIQSQWKMNILLVISYTLISVYEGIVNKFTLVPINSEEFQDLRKLTNKFLAYKYFRKPIPHFVNLLIISIRYAFQDINNLEFLCVARYFIDLICDKTSKIRVQNFFAERKGAEAIKNDAVVYFWNYLKSFKVKELPADKATSLLNSLSIQETETTKSKGNKKSAAKTKPKDKGKSKDKEKITRARKYESEGSKANKEILERNTTKMTRRTTSCSDDLDSLEDYSVHDSTSDDLEQMSD